MPRHLSVTANSRVRAVNRTQYILRRAIAWKLKRKYSTHYIAAPDLRGRPRWFGWNRRHAVQRVQMPFLRMRKKQNGAIIAALDNVVLKISKASKRCDRHVAKYVGFVEVLSPIIASTTFSHQFAPLVEVWHYGVRFDALVTLYVIRLIDVWIDEERDSIALGFRSNRFDQALR